MCVACVRTKRTYQQSINRMFKRKTKYEFYWPSLANIGEQAVKMSEIYAKSSFVDGVFGYQEAWAEYRYKPDLVTGQFRHDANNGSLDAWHYADWYNAQPVLSASWMNEGDSNVNRTLAVDSSIGDQFLLDVYFKNICARPMPVHSIPGLADHY